MKKFLALFCALLMAASLMAGCGSSSNGTSSSGDDGNTSVDTVSRKTEEGTLVIGLSEEPTTMEPANAQLVSGWVFTSAIYDNLISYDEETGEYVGILAESCEFVTDTQLVIKLKEGITFHNGTPLTADDVLFTLERLAASSRYSTNYSCIDFDNCVVNDDLTLTVNLSTPYPALLGFLCHPSAGVMSRAYYDEVGEEGLAQSPMGTGAFVFESWTSGDRAIATKNENYWDSSVDIDYETLIVRFITEATTRQVEFDTGGIDIILDVSSDDVTRFENGEISGAILTSLAGERITRLEMLDTYEPLTDPNVRLAIAHAIDIPAVVEAAYGNAAEYTTSVLPADCNYYMEMPAYEYDPELSMELLEEAGYADGFTVQCSVGSDSDDAKAMELIQYYLGEVGITVEITTTDVSTSITDMLNGVANFGVINGTIDSHDPDQGLSNMKTESVFAISSTNDATLDSYLVTGATSVADEDRQAAYEAAQQYIYDYATSIPICVSVVNYACWNYIDEFPVQAIGFIDVKDVTFK